MGKKYIVQSIVVDEHAGQVVVVWGGALSRSQENPWSASKIVKGLITEIESLDIDRKFNDRQRARMAWRCSRA